MVTRAEKGRWVFRFALLGANALVLLSFSRSLFYDDRVVTYKMIGDCICVAGWRNGYLYVVRVGEGIPNASWHVSSMPVGLDGAPTVEISSLLLPQVQSQPSVPRLFVSIPMLPLMVLLAFLAYRELRRPLRGPGECPACGYDLRATPERCSECGRAATRTV
jgi:hypothetical protein